MARGKGASGAPHPGRGEWASRAQERFCYSQGFPWCDKWSHQSGQHKGKGASEFHALPKKLHQNTKKKA